MVLLGGGIGWGDGHSPLTLSDSHAGVVLLYMVLTLSMWGDPLFTQLLPCVPWWETERVALPSLSASEGLVAIRTVAINKHWGFCPVAASLLGDGSSGSCAASWCGGQPGWLREQLWVSGMSSSSVGRSCSWHDGPVQGLICSYGQLHADKGGASGRSGRGRRPAPYFLGIYPYRDFLCFFAFLSFCSPSYLGAVEPLSIFDSLSLLLSFPLPRSPLSPSFCLLLSFVSPSPLLPLPSPLPPYTFTPSPTPISSFSLPPLFLSTPGHPSLYLSSLPSLSLLWCAVLFSDVRMIRGIPSIPKYQLRKCEPLSQPPQPITSKRIFWHLKRAKCAQVTKPNTCTKLLTCLLFPPSTVLIQKLETSELN